MKTRYFFFLLGIILLTPNISFAQLVYPNLSVIKNECDSNGMMIDNSVVWSGVIVVEGRLRIKTLVTVLPGTVIKFKEDGIIFIEDDNVLPCAANTVNGILDATGTAANPIIFTSYKDDTYGGDTNMDGNATSPDVGDWGRVVVLENGDGIFEHCTFKYGGEQQTYDPGNIVGSALGIYGVGVINDCHFEENGSPYSFFDQGTGLSIAFGTNPTISNLSFGPNEHIGIGLTNSYGLNSPQNGSDILPIYPYPYLINKRAAIIKENETITIQPGTIIKMSEGSLFVEGTLNALGTPTEPIIFTSLYDDSYAGDTNQDGMTTSPTKGNWGRLTIQDTGNATIDHAIFKYGGMDTNNDSNPNGSALAIYGHGDVMNCHFEDIGSNRSFYGSGIGLSVGVGATHTISSLSFGPNENIGVGIISGGNNGMYTIPKYPLYPYLAHNSTVEIKELQSITIQEGTVFKLHYSNLKVKGTLNSYGTSTQPIVFTSLLDDSFVGDTNQDGSTTIPSSNDWLCLEASGQIHLTYTDIFHSGCMQRPIHFTNPLFESCQIGMIEQLGSIGLSLTDFEKMNGDLLSRDIFKSTDSVTIESEGSITLLPGFTTELGATFTAQTIACPL